MALGADQFAKALIAAGLFSADEVKAFWSSLPADQRPADGKAFAKLLNEQKKLTKFQAGEVLSGSKTPLVLGDYVLLDKIGAGGMGQVFKAQHRHMDRLAAIKLLPPTLTRDEAAVKRFQREVKAAARLSHPHIVQTFDASVQRGVWYLVMEYVEGRDLSGIVSSDGPLPIAQAVKFIRQAAQGLAFAHESGVVHRDIKPANLLVDKKGNVKILDMGLARFEDAQAAKDGLTESGQVMGTVDYMAPEQAFDVHTADARADIYSLGCTLYRLLTNRSMYEAESLVQKLMAHQNKPVPPLATHRADTPPPLVAIFEQMVAKQPADRFQTMAEVEAALTAFENPHSASSTTSKPEADSKLSSFLQTFSGKKPSATAAPSALAPAPQPTVKPTPEVSPTVSLNSAQINTDPISDRSIQIAREQPDKVAVARETSWWKNPPAIIAAGLATVLLIALGIWGWSLNSNQPAKIPVAPGDSVTTVNNGPPTKTGWQGWPADAPKPAIAPFTVAEAKAFQVAWAEYLKVPREWENSIGMKFVLIPPGEFMMGGTADEIAAALKDIAPPPDDMVWRECIQSEAPQHKVILTKPIYVGQTEVTQDEYEKVMGLNPSQFTTTSANKEHPVETVSWYDAADFCAKLSLQQRLKPFYQREGETVRSLAGNGYRLLTEAEWEFACRAGTTTKYWIGDKTEDATRVEWFEKNGDDQTHPVGKLQVNPFGLVDMNGNVSEWVQDGMVPNFYAKFQDQPAIDPVAPNSDRSSILRGGNWIERASAGRSAARHVTWSARRETTLGIRVALPVDAVKTAIAEAPSNLLPAIDYAAEREAAQTLISICILKIRLASDFERLLTVEAGSKLPNEQFVVAGVHVPDRAQLPTDFDQIFIAALAKLGRLEEIWSPLSYEFPDAEFKRLGEMSVAATLTNLTLQNHMVATTIPVLKKMQRLKSLHLIGIYTDDETLEMLAELPSLKDLNLFRFGAADGGKRITPSGLQALSKLRVEHLGFHNSDDFASQWNGRYSLFAKMPCLVSLTIGADGMGVKDFEDLVGWQRLGQLNFQHLKNVSRESLAAFHRARPDVELKVYDNRVQLDIAKIEKTFPAVGETIDVLSLVNPEKHSRNGKWQKQGGGLSNPADVLLASLELPVEPTASYRIEAVAERLAGSEPFAFVLPLNDAETMLLFEAHSKKWSGLENVAGKNLAEQATKYDQPIFTAGKPTTFVIDVAPERITATCDGKQIVDWSGESRELSVNEPARIIMQGASRSLMLATWLSQFRITKLTYTALADPPATKPGSPAVQPAAR